MTTPAEPKKIRLEVDEEVAKVGDNRSAEDPDGNKAAGDAKSPGVTQPEDAAQETQPTRPK